MTCTSGATCPSAHHLDDGTWLIVGRHIPDTEARQLGGNPDADEAAVIVPSNIIDSITAPLRARIAELEAERDQQLPGETPFTENLACNLMMMPSLGSGRVAVTILDTRDGQVVTLSGVYLGTGMRRVDETPSHPLYNELTVKVALLDPAPGEDVPYPVADDANATEDPK